MRTTLVGVALLVALVLAGCSAPGATPTATERVTTAETGPADGVTETEPGTSTVETTGDTDTPTDENGAQTLQAAYGIDANETFQRVEKLLGVEYDRPTLTFSRNRTVQAQEDYESSLQADPFLVTFGLAGTEATSQESSETNDTSSDESSFRIIGYTDGPRSIVLNPNLSRARAEGTLAHELVHVVQIQESWRPRWEGRLIVDYRATPGRDVAQVWDVMQEGPATYGEYAYVDEYFAWAPSIEELIDSRAASYRNTTGSAQLALAPYYYGLEYIHSNVDDPSGIPALYDRSPVTTEQMLHDLTQAEEPPAPLSVSVRGLDSQRRGAQGELFTRIALDQALNRSRSITAAAGWGNDTLLSVGDERDGQFVWVTRWDTATDATEFQQALRTTLERRDTVIDRTTTVHQVAPETVVLVAGDEGFVDAVRVRGTNQTVRIDGSE